MSDFHDFEDEFADEKIQADIASDNKTVRADAIERLRRICEEFHGDHPVVVDIRTSAGSRRLRLGPAFRVRPDQALFAEIQATVGSVSVA